jgi:hypothetical protein
MAQSRHVMEPRWLLLCLLLLGLIGMHHFVPTSPHDVMAAMPAAVDVMHDAPAHEPESPGNPAPSHDLMHLCMAIVCATVGLLLIALLLTVFRRDRDPVPSSPDPLGRVDRPPGLFGRTLLTSVCVLRE